MEDDLGTTDRIGEDIQRPVAIECPIVSDVRLQQFARFIKSELLLNHPAKLAVSGFMERYSAPVYEHPGCRRSIHGYSALKKTKKS